MIQILSINRLYGVLKWAAMLEELNGKDKPLFLLRFDICAALKSLPSRALQEYIGAQP